MNKLKILIVDDEPGMRTAVERALSGHRIELPDLESGFECEILAAGSGESALETIGRENIDLLLLDHKLPGISGMDVLHRLAEKQPDLITVMITAYASIETAITATRNGAYDFLAKPFTPEELKAAVSKAVRHLALQRQARRLAEEKRRVRFEFVSVLAHELKAPLAAVEQCLGLIEQTDLNPDERRRLIGRSLARIHGMRKMIMNLLDLTRIESGHNKRDLTELDIVQIAKDVADDEAAKAADRKIAISLHSPQSLIARADRWEIETVIRNLVSNAVKFNRDQGRVSIQIHDSDNSYIIRVSDEGIGISEEDLKRLFKEFARVKSEQTEKIPGSGLGLSIVKKIAGLYGGKVSAESTPGKGSAFTVEMNKLEPEPGGRP